MVSDLLTFLRGASRRNLLFAGIALLITTGVLVGFLLETRARGLVPPPRVIYMQDYSAARTADDVRREQRRDETARQVAIAEFEAQRSEARLARAPDEAAAAARRAEIARYLAEAERWRAENAAALLAIKAAEAAARTPEAIAARAAAAERQRVLVEAQRTPPPPVFPQAPTPTPPAQ